MNLLSPRYLRTCTQLTVAMSVLTFALSGCFDSDDNADTHTDYGIRWGGGNGYAGASDDPNNQYTESGDLAGSEPEMDSTPVYINDTKLDPPPGKVTPGEAGPNTRRQRYVGTIMRVSEQIGVEVELIHAIISRESLYNTNAGSHAGAKGMMQLLDSSGRRFNCTSLFNAECNIKAGTRYLKFLLKRYNGNIQTVATGYNAGEAVADSYLHGTKLKGKNPTGIKTPNGVPLGSFSMTAAQKRVCPRNNWHPTPKCEGETYHYVRKVTGFYLMYKQMPELVGKAAKESPSAIAYRRGNIE